MLDYLWLIGIIVFLAIWDKTKETLVFLFTFVLPYFILVEVYPATFEGIERLLLICLLTLLSFGWLFIYNKKTAKA